MKSRSCDAAVRRWRSRGAGLIVWALAGLSWADEVPRAGLEEARKASAELVSGVGSELVKAIEASGPLRAIVVCKYTVPEISSAISRKYGARVTRVSLSPRNPSLATADVWEQKTLLGFEQRLAQGERGDAIDHAEVVTEPTGRYLRYMKALPMQPICAQCHGTADQIPASIRNELAHDYPQDKGAGLLVGKIRGAVSFKKPL